uniref:Putative hydrophobic protein n=1 Tax=Limosilactobacillus fermentum TaxID=1613 RepID=Q64J92_LIMFE|nr:putative hydrophobic protein [Limosilactobacillus fermentum]
MVPEQHLILLLLYQQDLLLSMMPLVVTLAMFGFVNHEKTVMVTWLFVMLRLTNLLENLNKILALAVVADIELQLLLGLFYIAFI